MNKKGFTLIEIICVVAILGLLFSLATVGINKLTTTAKEKTLKTKIKNIEKAAILYAQDNNLSFNTDCDLCNGKNNCKCYGETITVSTLIDEGLLEKDDTTGIQNPMDTSEHLNNCVITIYKKYGHIYAVYTKKYDDEKINKQCYK